MSGISDYFRTALLIDDRVAADYLPLEPLREELTEHSGDEPVTGLRMPTEEDETPVHPSELVRAFLKEGVVCSVLEATEDADGAESLVQQALQGSMIADLLLLDWLMYGDYSSTLQAIQAVATQHSERLAVIVIFTGAHSLGNVVQRLVDEAQFEAVDDYAVRRNNTVVLVFGKPGVQLTGDEDQRQAVDYGELPRMIRDDLELIYRGLMPEFAFSGINALRQSAPRMLATFSADLDAGALVHRALLPDPDEAAAQFTRLLSSDMELALYDAQISDIWDIDASSEVLARLTADGDASPLADKLRRSPNVVNDLKDLGDAALVRRAIASGLARIGLGDTAITTAADGLEAAVAGVAPSNESLAVLFDSTGFGDAPPRLELGVVLMGEPTEAEPEQGAQHAGRHLWLCVQPLCDSVRLREPRAFPLVPILVDAGVADAMICLPDGVPTGVSFVTRLHELRQVRFAPSEAGAVIAQGNAPNWYVPDEDDTRYRVVTRLRPELAAQVAHTLGATATRIGTDRSEWLRRGRSS